MSARRQRIVDDLEELEELRQEEGDDVSVAELRKILSSRKKAAKKRAKAARERRKRGAPKVKLPARLAGVHPTRPWWRLDGARWLRTDGRWWHLRPDEVLEAELAQMDATITLRPGAPERWVATSTPIPAYAWRRIPRSRAPLLQLAELARLQRRLATAERDARVRPSAVAAAAFASRLVEAQRERVRGLRVGVPWGGQIYGRGVAP